MSHPAPFKIMPLTRRTFLAASALTWLAPGASRAASAEFDSWRAQFAQKAAARGVSMQTYQRVMGRIEPDMSVFAKMRRQPEFHEALWQYLNRRVSDWRLRAGVSAYAENRALFARIERDFGVERAVMLGLWGIETAYGDPLVQKNHMKPVFPSLAALAWREPRRRRYWETELINALRIVERGWSSPEEMRGSWAGAMGHTQWMPEVWLNVGIDYDGDGRVSPFGRPDDALGSSARYLLQRGKYRRGEHWGYEVRASGGPSGWQSFAQWQAAGVRRADGKAFAQPSAQAKLWIPTPGGPAFLLCRNFYAVRSYNPSMSYTLAICHLGDRLTGGGPFLQPFPGSERALTLEEIQEVQTRLTRLGFDTAGTDGRVGSATMRAVRDFQARNGISPADGYAGLKELKALRAR